VFCSLLFSTKSFATKWVHPIVVWNGLTYVVSDEYVTDIDKEIGKVTEYSDMKQLPGNFSNSYREGTKYYSIKGIKTDILIAVEVEGGTYKKAIERNAFEGNFEDVSEDTIKEEKFILSDVAVSLYKKVVSLIQLFN
jgi:phosphate-selective porin